MLSSSTADGDLLELTIQVAGQQVHFIEDTGATNQ